MGRAFNRSLPFTNVTSKFELLSHCLLQDFCQLLYYTAKNVKFIISIDLQRMWLEANVASIEVISMRLKWIYGKPWKPCQHSRSQDWNWKQRLKGTLCSFSKKMWGIFQSRHGNASAQRSSYCIWKCNTFRHPDSLHTLSCWHTFRY
jgi:hypothetical protein